MVLERPLPPPSPEPPPLAEGVARIRLRQQRQPVAKVVAIQQPPVAPVQGERSAWDHQKHGLNNACCVGRQMR